MQNPQQLAGSLSLVLSRVCWTTPLSSSTGVLGQSSVNVEAPPLAHQQHRRLHEFLSRTIEPQATYADLLAVLEPLVAEILCGELHTHLRPAPSHAVTSSSIGDELVSPFHKGPAALAAGGFWTSRRCILASMCWFPILQAGAGSGCRKSRKPPISNSLWIGCAKCCRPPRLARLVSSSSQFMWNSELPTAGWWTRKSSCWKPLPCKTGNGLCWGVMEETMKSVLHRLTRSLFRSPCSGRSECGGSCAIFQPKASASLFASTNGAFKHDVLRIRNDLNSGVLSTKICGKK